MDRATLIEVLKRDSPTSFLETHVFDRVPELFGGSRSQYVEWKRTLANSIEVDPACITIVGSAATGASLNPDKNFKAFNSDSDVDVAVISSYHFTQSWRYLRMNGTRRLSVDQRTRIAWDEHVKRYIYWGTIATDRLLGILPFGLQWLDAKGKMSKIEPTIGRDVNLRIYTDYESLRAYQLNSVKLARDSLFS
jgi:predicted nucleotidyltransferase